MTITTVAAPECRVPQLGRAAYSRRFRREVKLDSLLCVYSCATDSRDAPDRSGVFSTDGGHTPLAQESQMDMAPHPHIGLQTSHLDA